MKNIHVLPTDKPSTPSRLFYKDQELVFSKKYSVFNGVNIYITSDEEIKDGDWIFNFITEKIVKSEGLVGAKAWIKIILTTDQELIKDGVQAIPDEFLEWFVKNPSCEEIKTVITNEINILIYDYEPSYKINLPKEEPKQELERGIKITHVGKQETLEEAAERLYPTTIDSFTDSGIDLSERDRIIFTNGAKWQQERSYSEEEVFNLLMEFSSRDINSSSGTPHSIAKWFEQFKKK